MVEDNSAETFGSMMVVDPEMIEESMLEALGEDQQNDDKVRAANHEFQKYRWIYHVSFNQGKRFAGLVPGGLPHIQVQYEGTRVMALASIQDDAQLCLLMVFFLNICAVSVSCLRCFSLTYIAHLNLKTC